MIKVVFQSTLPVRGATNPPNGWQLNLPNISIHAPRAGSDFPAQLFVKV